MRKALIAVPLLLVATLAMLAVFFPTQWLADRIEAFVLDKTGYTLTITKLDLELLRWQPSMTLSGVSVDGAEIPKLISDAVIFGAIDLRSLLRGQLLVDKLALQGATVLVQRENDKSNTWSPAMLTSADDNVSPTEKQTFSLPMMRHVEIDDLKLRLDDAVNDYEATLLVEGEGSTLADALPVNLTLLGDVQGQPVEAQLTASTTGTDRSILEGVSVKLNILLESIKTTVVGTVGDPLALRDIELEALIEADDLAALETILQRKLPDVTPVTFSSAIQRDDNDVVFRHFELNALNSSMQGDIRVNPTTLPATVYANVIAPQVDLDTLLGMLRAGTGVDTQTATSPTSGERTEPGRSVLPTKALPLALLIGKMQGAIDLDAAEVLTDHLPIESVTARAELDTNSATLSLAEVNVAGGVISGTIILQRLGSADQSASIDPGEKDSPEPVPVAMDVEIALKRINVGQFLRLAELPDVAGGLLGGRVKYWAEGASIASLAGSLDGGAYLLMTGGTVDSLLLELAGIDLFQSLGDLIVPGKEDVKIRCAYADLHSENGKTTLKEFVIDTTDTVMLANGSFNLKSETLDLVIEPHPKDASLLSASTAVAVDGTFASPEIRANGSLLARAAAVAVLSQAAAPALALLPLIEPSAGNDSPFCNGLKGGLDDATNRN